MAFEPAPFEVNTNVQTKGWDLMNIRLFNENEDKILTVSIISFF